MGDDDEGALQRLKERARKFDYNELCYISQIKKLEDDDVSDVYQQNIFTKLDPNIVANRVCFLRSLIITKSFLKLKLWATSAEDWWKAGAVTIGPLSPLTPLYYVEEDQQFSSKPLSELPSFFSRKVIFFFGGE